MYRLKWKKQKFYLYTETLHNKKEKTEILIKYGDIIKIYRDINRTKRDITKIQKH